MVAEKSFCIARIGFSIERDFLFVLVGIKTHKQKEFEKMQKYVRSYQ